MRLTPSLVSNGFTNGLYRSTDTPQGGGTPVEDTGKGLSIFHQNADGQWRVARDAWSSDLPLPTETPQ
jgi:ketosteroid isomerase-like protein